MLKSSFFPKSLIGSHEYADERTLSLMKRSMAGAMMALGFSIAALAMVSIRTGWPHWDIVSGLLTLYFVPAIYAYRYLRKPAGERSSERARRHMVMMAVTMVSLWSAVGMIILPGLDADTRLIAVSIFIVVVYAHCLPFSLFPMTGMALMALNLLPLSIQLTLLGDNSVIAFGLCGVMLLFMEVGTFCWLYRKDMLSLSKSRQSRVPEKEPDMSDEGFRRRLVYTLHSNSTPAVMMQAVAAFFLVITLRVEAYENLLWCWLLGYLSLQTLRTAGFIAHVENPERLRLRDWRRLFGVGVVLNQLAWYSLLILFHDIMSGFSLGVVSGMFIVIAVVSTVGITGDRLLLYLNSAMCLVPPVLILFSGEEVWSMVSLGMLACVSLLIIVENIHRSALHSLRGRVLQRLTEYRSRKMAELNDDLTDARERLTEVNANLEQQIEERTQELNYQATHDMLTGLGNRYYFSRKVSEALKEQTDEQTGFAVYLLDLDRFKEVNDGLGHLAGDHVLRVIAARIANACGEQVICARWGGDEFVILERRDVSEVEVEEFATGLVAELRKPIELDSGPVSLGASVGIALCPEHGSSAEQLLEHADIAVYRAKSRKTGVSVYDDKWGHEASERLQLVQALGYAIEHDDIEIALQPFVSVEDGSLTGFEALARWHDNVRNVAISPGTFIPLAEESGLMPAMGRMILRKACETLMKEAPDTDLRVAVNISVMQLRQHDFVDDVVSTLAAANMPASRLELELTESVFAGDVLQIRQVLSTLRNLGVRISIDDFGTGYSSISYLRDFPLDTLKIDQSFVAGLRNGGEGLFSSIVSLAHGLKLSVIVEGVENRHDLDKVLSLGGEEIQGYFFARPIESGKLGDWLDKHSTRPFSMKRRHLSVAVDNQTGHSG
jgi:diguanylate cyclase (GGDEF)-like protein